MSGPQGVEELYEKQVAEHRRLDAARIAEVDKRGGYLAYIDLMLDRRNREAIEGHLRTTWSDRRPDIIEALLGLLAWQEREIDLLDDKLERARRDG